MTQSTQAQNRTDAITESTLNEAPNCDTWQWLTLRSHGIKVDEDWRRRAAASTSQSRVWGAIRNGVRSLLEGTLAAHYATRHPLSTAGSRSAVFCFGGVDGGTVDVCGRTVNCASPAHETVCCMQARRLAGAEEYLSGTSLVYER